MGNFLGIKWKKYGTKIKNVVSKVGDAVGMIPGIGTAVGAVLKVGAKFIPESQQQAVVNAVNRDGEINVAEIEKTVANNNPSMSIQEVSAATQTVVQELQAAPETKTAKVNDSTATTKVSFGTKLKGFINQYKMFLLIGIPVVGVGIFFLVRSKKGGKKRRR